MRFPRTSRTYFYILYSFKQRIQYYKIHNRFEKASRTSRSPRNLIQASKRMHTDGSITVYSPLLTSGT